MPTRHYIYIILEILIGLAAAPASGQTDSVKNIIDLTKSYTTAMVHGDAPKIDGLSSDVAWEMVPWGGGDFRQRNPDAGAAPSVQTWFKVVYDAKNLYILIKNLDPEPNKIVSRMSRRDGFDGDWVEVNIDSYADKRSVFSFTSSVSGQYLCVEVHLSLCIIGDSSQALLLLIFI